MTSRSYAFPVREVAAVFVAVGTGASYLQAADRARVAAQRERLPGERGGALVAEWLDLFAPAVIAPHVEVWLYRGARGACRKLDSCDAGGPAGALGAVAGRARR